VIKKILRKLVLFELKALAKRRMRRFRGKVIAITGSVGKTSTKEAIFSVLNSRFKVKKNKGNMNSDFGIPLTILDIDSGFSSATKWSWRLLKAYLHSFMRDHSEILLLEFGIDKPGDMDFLLSVVRPDVAVFTGVAPVHMDDSQFKTIEDIFHEKSKLVEGLREKGVAVLNNDDEMVKKLIKSRRGRNTVTFGKDRTADFWASQVKTSLDGLDFVLHHDNKRYSFNSKAVGECQVYSVLSAICCGVLSEIPIEEMADAVKSFSPPPGRMSVIKGVSDSTILDSSYNSSPIAAKEALKNLSTLGENKRKIAVLGNMNELGENSKQLHFDLGKNIFESADVLLTVGSDAKFFAEGAVAEGFDKKMIHSFMSAKEAADFFKDKIKKDDLILVKGSQNRVRLERFVKEIMAFPEEAPKVLVRQGKEWNYNL
jgi:UDP-N-acetylmuramoyl-tripeptide--D-alanyl-D-alanine ligase